MTIDGMVPFPPEFAAAYRKAGYWRDIPLGAYFDGVFAKYADRPAIVSGPERITFRELRERVERLALHLYRMGLRPLDRVVVQLPNVPEFVYLYFALQRLGAIPLMALPAHRYLEISSFVELAGAVAYAIPASLGGTDLIELATRIQGEKPTLKHVLVYGATPGHPFVNLHDLLDKDSGLSPDVLEGLEVDPDEPACFQLSGGTTGVPKIIPRTHNDYLYNSEASGAVNDIHPDDALLVVLPIAHNFPLASPGIQAFFMEGARIVLSTSTQPKDAFPLIEQEQVTHVELVPALLVRWNNEPAIADHDLSSLRIVNTGGQKLQPEVKQRTESLVPSCRVQEVFGMAEGLLMLARLDDPENTRWETVGRPVSAGDEVRLVDDEGRDVPPGEIGELVCRGPYTLRGYFRTPEQNATAFTPDGFYKTGDLMRRHPSGNYVVEGRKKDLINRGGEKISAEEVENLLLSHPAIQNVACVHMPDPVLGERMCAYIIPKPGQSVTLAEIQAFGIEKGLAKFKLPERVELVPDLPLSGFGKVSKKELAERIAAKLKEEGGRKPA